MTEPTQPPEPKTKKTAEPAPAAEAPAGGKSVTYTGFGTRTITGDDWNSLGSATSETTVFEAGKPVPAAEFDDKALAWLDRQPNFTVTGQQG